MARVFSSHQSFNTLRASVWKLIRTRSKKGEVMVICFSDFYHGEMKCERNISKSRSPIGIGNAISSPCSGKQSWAPDVWSEARQKNTAKSSTSFQGDFVINLEPLANPWATIVHPFRNGTAWPNDTYMRITGTWLPALPDHRDISAYAKICPWKLLSRESRLENALNQSNMSRTAY